MKAFNAFLRGLGRRVREYRKPLNNRLREFPQRLLREVYNNLVRSIATVLVTVVLFYGGYNVFEDWKTEYRTTQREERQLRPVELSGCVVATDHLLPLDNVRVSVRGSSEFESYTDAQGEFLLELELPQDSLTVDLLFQRAGYKEEFYYFIAVPPSGTGLHKTYQLEPLPNNLVASSSVWYP